MLKVLCPPLFFILEMLAGAQQAEPKQQGFWMPALPGVPKEWNPGPGTCRCPIRGPDNGQGCDCLYPDKDALHGGRCVCSDPPLEVAQAKKPKAKDGEDKVAPAPREAPKPIVLNGEAGNLFRLKSSIAVDNWLIVEQSFRVPERSYESKADNTLIIAPHKGGEFQVYAIGVDAGKSVMQQFTLLVVGKIEPPPGPGPTPPTPQTYPEKIAAALVADKATPQERKDAAGLYSSFARMLDPIATLLQFKTVVDNSTSAVLKDRLPQTRALVNTFLSEMVPGYGSNVPFSGDFKARAQSAFEATAAAIPLEPGPGPGPTPGPGPKELLGAGKKVAIIYESGDLESYPPSQRSMFTSVELHSYLKANTTPEPDGRTGYRFLDPQNVIDPNLAAKWKIAIDRPRTGLPWIIISTPNGSIERALPNTTAETIALLRQHLGA